MLERQAADGDRDVITSLSSVMTSVIDPGWAWDFVDPEGDHFEKDVCGVGITQVFGLKSFPKVGLLLVKHKPLSAVRGVRDGVLTALRGGGAAPREAAHMSTAMDKWLELSAAADVPDGRPEEDGEVRTLWVEFDKNRSRHKGWEWSASKFQKNATATGITVMKGRHRRKTSSPSRDKEATDASGTAPGIVTLA